MRLDSSRSVSGDADSVGGYCRDRYSTISNTILEALRIDVSINLHMRLRIPFVDVKTDVKRQLCSRVSLHEELRHTMVTSDVS